MLYIVRGACMMFTVVCWVMYVVGCTVYVANGSVLYGLFCLLSDVSSLLCVV